MDKLYLALSVIAAALAGGLAWKFFHYGRHPYLSGEEAEEAKEKKRHEIKNIPAASLVDAAVNSEKLRADAGAIAGKFRQRLRDRARKILSGNGSAGTDGNG
jgi:hypothetical protein